MRRTVVIPDPLPDLLKPGEAALMLRVDAKTLTRWAKQGAIDCVYTAGGHRRYRTRDVERIMRGARRV